MTPTVISAVISLSMRLAQRLTVTDWGQMREWGGGVGARDSINDWFSPLIVLMMSNNSNLAIKLSAAYQSAKGFPPSALDLLALHAGVSGLAEPCLPYTR